jgi:hypothetical protein
MVNLVYCECDIDLFIFPKNLLALLLLHRFIKSSFLQDSQARPDRLICSVVSFNSAQVCPTTPK